MGMALRNRFNGNKEEVIRDTELYGRSYAMDKHQVKDYIAFSKFLEQETGNPNFGTNPQVNPYFVGDEADRLLEAFGNYYVKSKTVIESLTKERDYWKDLCKRRNSKRKEKMVSLSEAFEK